ncbi:MAG TPA: bifunctional 1-(5-phosphoribosyl)-5-((5-phosphoribosylamino)methylideneamino)imidazole-4-carboxamide isomerase/phosphoribosylanthranilate isomerase PriA [Stackebrandtia sp.]|jgi:phosphoribosylanthranilate isomerase|uniref:bifunctional 1-(5-phosphoribosyl)-5-((5- phosphoribosylamino)methylideneamino)imidazole-4- carboxamide isomerase/phosphoribosylanthranilate isomerase PriA n=1 Tax=Stackebrandtia sp. TaxID=2023065 RepID=UPI002D359A8F|nr:bifunctional 1-(5-phosphoribosyl)-5-((5-phosphoribosylamino)methylideneamino)imidazole-4-carboxamide isomerase/phosphoribosylanthranilate isomerase PriA [Stackebrandtia sp.]HZE38489.1 bifunctional 1-(5-phosphoribosyl)-5-((5-phosphoribosylamino)methylideneamino)imidazole-4-carboxamide isomerase/phosphoribosylanthranilate isomerase PriA [Stackebrandtia sp.]
MTTLTLLPAVDVTGGQAVQLVQGVDGSEKRYGDPIAAARRWQDQGATWLHLVDLDAAFGRGDNSELLAGVIADVDMEVEISGGIRDDATLARALNAGARRVNIGTAALEDPPWCERIIAEHGDRVAIGLDVRDGRLAARGWTRDQGELLDVLARLEAAGCARYVVTDVPSDGMLSGPNLDLLRQVCSRTDKPVVASGGVSTLDDLRALAGLADDGVEGVIVGTALYEGRFSVADALKILEES